MQHRACFEVGQLNQRSRAGRTTEPWRLSQGASHELGARRITHGVADTLTKHHWTAVSRQRYPPRTESRRGSPISRSCRGSRFVALNVGSRDELANIASACSKMRYRYRRRCGCLVFHYRRFDRTSKKLRNSLCRSEILFDVISVFEGSPKSSRDIPSMKCVRLPSEFVQKAANWAAASDRDNAREPEAEQPPTDFPDPCCDRSRLLDRQQ